MHNVDVSIVARTLSDFMHCLAPNHNITYPK